MSSPNNLKESTKSGISLNPTVPRVDVYRYIVDSQKVDLTPLAHVEASIGVEKIQVLNISSGGIALLVSDPAKYALNDLLDISLSIRERDFPVRVEIKNVRSQRLSCFFKDPSPVLQQALKEFLKSKYLGTTLKKNTELSQNQVYKELVPGTTQLEVYAGDNQTGVFVWLNNDRAIQKFLMLSQEFVLEWTPDLGLKTGFVKMEQAIKDESPSLEVNKKNAESQFENMSWTRTPSENLVHHFADILLAWMDVSQGPDFVKKLTLETLSPDSSLKFPKVG